MASWKRVKRGARWLGVAWVGALLIMTATAAAQDGYPTYIDLYVNDFADVINATDEAAIRQLLIDLKNDTDIEATVVTINSINDYRPRDETAKIFANGLFDFWGVGDATRNDGLLLLVAIEDRDTWIAVGAGYGTTMDDDLDDVINEYLLPHFRAGNYSWGIYRGTRAIIHMLTGEWPPEAETAASGTTSATASAASASAASLAGEDSAESSSSVSIPVPNESFSSGVSSYTSRTSSDDDGFGVSPWLIGGGGVGVLGVGATAWGRFRRFRKRDCSHCGTPMRRLDEASDDMYLESGAKVEEMLKSVDYDVWHCPNCNHHEIFSYSNWLSGFRRCPSCHYRTLRTSSRVLEAATTMSTGRREITRECRHCDFHDVDTVVIPRITQSSSSSGSRSSSRSRSSFGGGRSSGGGRGGKW